MNGPFAEAALAYAKAGLAVGPAFGKIPPCILVPKCPPGAGTCGFKHATTDVPTLQQLMRRFGTANIYGAVPEHLLVFDIDPRHGGCLESLGELPSTLMARSAGHPDGRHIWFGRPGGEIAGGRLPAGVELKKSGLVILPPSRHPRTGQRYEWLSFAPPAELPRHLLELLRVPPRRAPRPIPPRVGDRYGAAALQAETAEIAGTLPGNRNDRLFLGAAHLGELIAVGVLAESAVAERLIDAGVACGLEHHAAKATVESGLAHGKQRPRAVAR